MSCPSPIHVCPVLPCAAHCSCVWYHQAGSIKHPGSQGQPNKLPINPSLVTSFMSALVVWGVVPAYSSLDLVNNQRIEIRGTWRNLGYVGCLWMKLSIALEYEWVPHSKVTNTSTALKGYRRLSLEKPVIRIAHAVKWLVTQQTPVQLVHGTLQNSSLISLIVKIIHIKQLHYPSSGVL